MIVTLSPQEQKDIKPITSNIFTIMNSHDGTNGVMATYNKTIQIQTLYRSLQKNGEDSSTLNKEFTEALKLYKKYHIEEWGFFAYDTKVFFDINTIGDPMYEKSKNIKIDKEIAQEEALDALVKKFEERNNDETFFTNGNKFFVVFENTSGDMEDFIYENQEAYCKDEGVYLDGGFFEGSPKEYFQSVLDTEGGTLQYVMDTEELHEKYQDHKAYKALKKLHDGDLTEASTLIQENMYFNNELTDFLKSFDDSDFISEIEPSKDILADIQLVAMRQHIEANLINGNFTTVAKFIVDNKDRVGISDVPNDYVASVSQLIENRKPIELGSSSSPGTDVNNKPKL